MLGVSRERASERRSREGQGKGPSVARSQEAHFAYPSRRACSQANFTAILARHLIQTAHSVSSLSYNFDKISTDYVEPHQTKRLPPYQIDSDAALLLFLIHQLGSAHECWASSEPGLSKIWQERMRNKERISSFSLKFGYHSVQHRSNMMHCLREGFEALECLEWYL